MRLKPSTEREHHRRPTLQLNCGLLSVFFIAETPRHQIPGLALTDQIPPRNAR
jgi:hypothetical protein